MEKPLVESLAKGWRDLMFGDDCRDEQLMGVGQTFYPSEGTLDSYEIGPQFS